MKKLTQAMILSLSGLAFAQWAHAAMAEHFGKTVSLLETSDSECIFFQLTGVSEANPAVPNGVWFAFHKNDNNYKEMYALVLTARVSGTTLGRVLTNGQVVCGQSKVLAIDL